VSAGAISAAWALKLSDATMPAVIRVFKMVFMVFSFGVPRWAWMHDAIEL